MAQFLLYPPIALVIFIILGYLVYRLSSKWGAKTRFETGKLTSYACGEDIPGEKVQQGYHLFHFAFFFTILHVAALVIATVPGGNIALLGIFYLLVILVAVVILLIDK
jgi:hypothetical protein